MRLASGKASSCGSSDSGCFVTCIQFLSEAGFYWEVWGPSVAWLVSGLSYVYRV